MALHFVTPDAGAAQPGARVTLTGAEAKHAAVVRRVRLGEPITLGDGAGVWLEGEVCALEQGRVEVRILTRREDELPEPRILIAQALAKGDRDELAVQAACELGVDEVVPWQAARCVSRWDDAKAAKGRERWVKIVREAAKQAHRSWIPEVAAVESSADLARRAATQRLLILDPTASVPLSMIVPDDRDLLLVVGPEGGIAPDERAQLVAAGAEPVRLGDTVLRTSTAGPAAIAVLNVPLGRW